MGVNIGEKEGKFLRFFVNNMKMPLLEKPMITLKRKNFKEERGKLKEENFCSVKVMLFLVKGETKCTFLINYTLALH